MIKISRSAHVLVQSGFEQQAASIVEMADKQRRRAGNEKQAQCNADQQLHE